MDMMHYEIKGDCLVVYIRDDLDHHAVTYLRETSDRLIEAGNVKNIIFDVGQDQCDDTAIYIRDIQFNI